MVRTAALVTITLLSTISGLIIGQTIPISHDSTVTIGLLIGAAGGSFWVGKILTGITRDIKELKGTINSLPCVLDHHEKCAKK